MILDLKNLILQLKVIKGINTEFYNQYLLSKIFLFLDQKKVKNKDNSKAEKRRNFKS